MKTENIFECEIPLKLLTNSVSFKVSQAIPTDLGSEFVCVIKKKKEVSEFIVVEKDKFTKSTNNDIKTLF